MAEGAGGAPSRPARIPVDYIAGLITEFSAHVGRPQIRQRPGDHRRARALPRHAGHGRSAWRRAATRRRASSTISAWRDRKATARRCGSWRSADRFGLPVITFIDTAGAYPGIEAEERGQAEAIARSTDCCLGLGVPLVSVIIGEGGSGGAIALAAANSVLMLEHAIYSVISPEGAASILWRDASRAKDAASAMRITAQDLRKLGIIDDIIAEPVGGAHRGREETIAATGDAIAQTLNQLAEISPDALRDQRRDKFLAIGSNLPG